MTYGSSAVLLVRERKLVGVWQHIRPHDAGRAMSSRVLEVNWKERENKTLTSRIARRCIMEQDDWGWKWSRISGAAQCFPKENFRGLRHRRREFPADSRALGLSGESEARIASCVLPISLRRLSFPPFLSSILYFPIPLR